MSSFVLVGLVWKWKWRGMRRRVIGNALVGRDAFLRRELRIAFVLGRMSGIGRVKAFEKLGDMLVKEVEIVIWMMMRIKQMLKFVPAIEQGWAR
jgi:hypothetical protein